MAFVHKSVLFHETIDALNIRPEWCLCADGTAGGGGHSGDYVGTFDNRDFNFN